MEASGDVAVTTAGVESEVLEICSAKKNVVDKLSSAVDVVNADVALPPASASSSSAPPAPSTPAAEKKKKKTNSSLLTAVERETAAKEVLEALTASSSASAASRRATSTSTSSCHRVLLTADDAASDSGDEDFASEDSDAVERALGRAARRGGGNGTQAVAATTTSTATAAATTTATTGTGKASSLQPANASCRKLDAVFDGALRRVYFHDDEDDANEDNYDDFDDERGTTKRNNASSSSTSAPSASNSSSSLARTRDKSDRATVETVLDPRTRLVLFKLLNGGVFSAIHGCVSTGKEANVYLAVPGPSESSSRFSALAVKVYKTSILSFKDRERYVEGDARFSGGNAGGGLGFGGGGGKGASSKSGYCKGNARKMVRAWAEKEARNLARLSAAGVRSPAVVCLRSHVLAMEFVSDGTGGGIDEGKDGGSGNGGGNAAPRLKDARLSRSRAARAYREALGAMRAMWARARLVHADLSEYNMLYAPLKRTRKEKEEEEEGGGEGEDAVEEEEEEEDEIDDDGTEKSKKKKKRKKKARPSLSTPTHSVVVIDVSQSVDLDHPRALEFLRVDAWNVNAFFARRGVPPLTTREVFDFVTADDGAYDDDPNSDPSPSRPISTPFTSASAAPAASCADFDPERASMMTKGEERALDALLSLASRRSEASVAAGGSLTPEVTSADVVWASAHIPRRLADVADAERDAARLREGGAAAEGIYYQRFAGMTEDMERVAVGEEKKEKKEDKAASFSPGDAAENDDDGACSGGEGGSDPSSSDDSDSEGEGNSDDSDSSRSKGRRPSLKARACNLPPEEADAARAARKAAKAEAKAEARERRKTKTPKHVKKRAAAKARKKK